jgi:hypothetical protein
LLVGLLFGSSSALAQGEGDGAASGVIEGSPEPRDSEDSDKGAGWMPSLAISWGAFSQSIDGETLSSEGDLEPGTGDSFITTLFQFEGKLHTPFQLDIPSLGKPRLFVTAGVQIPLADELTAERIDEGFNDDQPGFAENCPPSIPLIPAPDPGNPRPPTGVTETCSLEVRNRLTMDAMWYLGLGVDFTLPILESQFHISPAFEYYGLSVQSVGKYKRSSSATGVDNLDEEVQVVGNSDTYHGISPSLTLSVDLYDDGPWRWSMFLQSRVVFMMTDADVSAQTSLGSNNITFDGELDNFIAQGSGGIQLQWTGK